MKRFLSFCAATVLAGFLALPVSANPEKDNLVNRNYDVDEFNSLVISVPSDVVYESGKPFLSISGTEKALSYIDVRCNNGKLEIVSIRKFRNIRKLSIIVSSDCLEYLEINGAADFECERGFDTKSLTVKMNGACELEMNKIGAGKMSLTLNGAGDMDLDNLYCDGSLNICINGAGAAEISGTSYSADLKINGAGSIDAKELNCGKVSSSVNGAGSIKTR